MRFYVATSLARSQQAEEPTDAERLIRLLTNLGHQITYNWMEAGPAVEMPWMKGHAEDIRHPSPPRRALTGPESEAMLTRAVLDMRGVLDADLVIVVLPGGAGSHTELGMALAAAHVGRRWYRHLEEVLEAFDVNEYDRPNVMGAMRRRLATQTPWVLLWAPGGLDVAHETYPCVFHHLADHVCEGDLADCLQEAVAILGMASRADEMLEPLPGRVVDAHDAVHSEKAQEAATEATSEPVEVAPES